MVKMKNGGAFIRVPIAAVSELSAFLLPIWPEGERSKMCGVCTEGRISRNL